MLDNSIKSLIQTPSGGGLDEMALVALSIGASGVLGVLVTLGLWVFAVTWRGESCHPTEIAQALAVIIGATTTGIGVLASGMGAKAKMGG